MKDIFGYVTKDFPKVKFIPDHSSRDKDKPDYYQIFFGSKYIGIVRQEGATLMYNDKKMEIVDNLKDLTRLSEEKCSKLVEIISGIDY